MKGLAAILLALFPCVAAAQDARVRASVGDKGDLFVGQRLTLTVELLAPGFFAGAPSFDLPDPPGVLLVPPGGRPTVGSEEVDGVSYAVQRHELSVIARRAGPQTIPPLTVRFHFKRNPLDKKTVPATVKTASLTFTAKSPPGAGKLNGIISARGLTAVETWHPEPGKAKAGDAFTRTVTFAADDVPAMAFPVFPAAKVDGLGVYPKPPEVLDRDTRGQLHGERRDVVTYVCKNPGVFVLPAVRLTWFDLDAKKVRRIDFPARTFDVAPNPAMSAAAAATQPTSDRPSGNFGKLFTAVLGVAVSGVLGIILLHRYGERWIAPLRPVHLAPLNPTSEETIP
jgi:hypothetical protein